MYPPVRVPVAIVVARWEYEAWLVASIATTASRLPGHPSGLHCPPNVEELPDPKGWLSQHVPRGQSYLPTRDQAPMTEVLDFALAAQWCPSFVRLQHALEQILTAQEQGTTPVTP